MPAPTLAGFPTVFRADTSGTTITLARPGLAQDDDLLVAYLRTNGSSSPSDFALAGWTRRGYVFIPNDAAGRVLGIYTHPIDDIATEPASYVFSKSVADTRRVGAMEVWRGVDLTNPIAGQALGWTTTGNVVNTHAFAIDTTDPVALLYVWGNEVIAPNSSTPSAVPAGSTFSALVDSAPVTDPPTTSVTRSVIWLGNEEVATTAPGTRSLTWLSVSGASAAAIALRGLSGPPAPTQGFRNVAEMLARKGATWAHRGGSLNWPEMSEYAYDQAVLAGYGALEFSAGRTSDGVWFGLHDVDLNRTSQTTGLPAASTQTWATVQTFQNTLNSAGTPRPYYRLIDFLDKYTPNNVVIVDPKHAIGTYDTEFLNLLDAHGGPSKIIVKFYGVGTGAAALATAAKARGYQTWGFFYEPDIISGDLALYQQYWSILGMDYQATTDSWNHINGYGKPVVSFIVPDQAAYTSSMSKGARFAQVSGVANVTAVGALPKVQPWSGVRVGTGFADAVYVGTTKIWP